MPKVVVRGESVYQCTICNRKTRVPTNHRGLDIIFHCTITAGCKGKLNRLALTKDIISTPTLTPAVVGLQDWFQRKVLYTHTQYISSNKWSISHNLDNKPTIHLFTNQYINGIKELVPTTPSSIVTIDANTTQLLFDQAETGIAQCVTMSSQNTINPIVYNTITSVDNIQYSNDAGIITIATLNSDTDIDFDIRFMITGQNPVTISYIDITSGNIGPSPWANTPKLYLNNQTYTVRTINIINHPKAIDYFLSGQIPPQGSAFYIVNLDGVSVKHGDVIMLGAKYPFDYVDKIYDVYVDLADETYSSGRVLYSFGKIYAAPSALKSAYPFITVV